MVVSQTQIHMSFLNIVTKIFLPYKILCMYELGLPFQALQNGRCDLGHLHMFVSETGENEDATGTQDPDTPTHYHQDINCYGNTVRVLPPQGALGHAYGLVSHLHLEEVSVAYDGGISNCITILSTFRMIRITNISSKVTDDLIR